MTYGGETEDRTSPSGNMYVGEVEAMSCRLLGEDSFLLPPTDSLHNMNALDAIAASARSGQKMLF